MEYRTTRLAVRRFLREVLGFDAPHPDVGAALAHHGFVQLDPINVCGRMHDLILRNRVAGYRENDLLRYLYEGSERRAFEHHVPSTGVLVAFPVDAEPHLRATMRARQKLVARYSGKLSAPEQRLATRILAEIEARGPLTSDDIEHEARADTAWGNRGRLVKVVLDKLFFHGRVLITTRRGFRRVYDLPERVLPAAVRGRPEPSLVETTRWRIQTALRQRRLVALKRGEAPVVDDLVARVVFDDGPAVHVLRSDLPALERAAAAGAEDRAPRLVAPLNPLVYDRRLASRIWDFDYIWEVYTPPAKRTRGYYALPVLAGTEIVGHVDPKADRDRGRLVVVSRSVRRGHAVGDAVRDLAAFLGLRSASARRGAGKADEPPFV